MESFILARVGRVRLGLRPPFVAVPGHTPRRNAGGARTPIARPGAPAERAPMWPRCTAARVIGAMAHEDR